MKILHLLDIPWWSGLSAYAFDCIESHQMLGHRVILACQKNSLPHKRALLKNWDAVAICGRGTAGGIFNFFLIGSLLLRERPDWAISHTGSTHWILWFWSKFMRIKIARTRATSQKIKKSFINRMIYSGSARIVAASGRLGKECADLLNGLAPNVAVLYPPVQIPQKTPDNVQTKALGMLARLDPVKGHRELLKAFKFVQSTFPGAELHLAGAEENLRWSDLLKDIDSLGIKNVVYHGFLPHEKIWDFTRNYAIGIVASIGSEEVSRALLEWMAQGKPVIATRVGCIPDILKDEEGGYLVAPFNAEQMAEKMKTLLIQPDLCRKMGDYNRKICEEQFTMKRFSRQWAAILGS